MKVGEIWQIKPNKIAIAELMDGVKKIKLLEHRRDLWRVKVLETVEKFTIRKFEVQTTNLCGQLIYENF